MFMSAINKMMEYLGLVDGPEGATEEAKPKPTIRVATDKPSTSTNGVTVIGGRAPVEADPALDLESSYNIVTLHPRSYSDARQMAEHYREGNPVIINLDDMDESDRKRLVDFASGLAFGLRGRIEKITSVVFLISPANVIVRTEDKAAYAQASFYNQS
jgi:cell division inhibitor SepF